MIAQKLRSRDRAGTVRPSKVNIWPRMKRKRTAIGRREVAS